MTTCPNCHQSIPDNSTVCPVCGAAIQAQQPQAQQPQFQQQPQAQQPQAQQPQAQQPQFQQQPYAQPTQPYGYPQQGQMPPPGYAHPQAGFMPPPGYPPQQPGYGPPPGYPPHAAYPEQPGVMSPKTRNTVVLLCFFFGIIGVHRFYLGKIVTGILMIVTFGGLGIWYIVDFFISIFGKYNDSQGRYVSKQYSVGMAVVLIIITVVGIAPFFIFFVLGVLGAISLPQFAHYRQETMDNAAESAYHNISLAEEAYYAYNDKYTTDYNALIQKAALERDPSVEYGEIELCLTDRGSPGFKFTVKHKQSTTYYDYNTCSVPIVQKRTGR